MLKAAVGTREVRRAVNNANDVEWVQTLLKHAAAKLGNSSYDPGTIDKSIHRDPEKSATVQAIFEFQRTHQRMPEPDGVVDPSGATWDALVATTAVGDLDIYVRRLHAYSKSIGGKLYLNDAEVCYSLERPWRNNERNVSCIPGGTYGAFLRYTSQKANREWCVQLKDADTAPRTAIQIHIANKPEDLEGCVAVGLKLSENFVAQSVDAYRKFQGMIFGSVLNHKQIRALQPAFGTVTVHVDPPVMGPGDFPLRRQPTWGYA